MKSAAAKSGSVLIAICALAWQWAVMIVFFMFVAENRAYVNAFISTMIWEPLLDRTGGYVIPTAQGMVGVTSLRSLASLTALLSVPTLLAMCWNRWSGRSKEPRESFARICLTMASWTIPPAIWVAGCWLCLISTNSLLHGMVIITPSLAFSVTVAGWLWECLKPRSLPASIDSPVSARRCRIGLWIGILTYTVIFTALNWGLWFNLQIPHGDSSMYEEHLWNVLHGKGFRSYLDQGLFLGEHIQVVHLLLLPLYMLWPSHLLLELCQSAIIALTAIPVYRLALRHSGSPRVALWLALATLLYFPLHYLDIAIDFKTFRPSAFGIPTLLFAIDALERRKWWSMAGWSLLTLSSQEDFAIVLCLLGVWQVATSWFVGAGETIENAQPQTTPTPALPLPGGGRKTPGVGRTKGPRDVRGVIAGIIIATLAAAYLVAAVKFVIPWFRSGETVHYVRYFEKFGKTAPEVVWNMLTRPSLLLNEMLQVGSVAYLLMMLIPLGVPWRAWSRLLVGLPLYVLLCLNEVAQATPGPFHHFHAPLIPVILWAACASLCGGTVPNTAPLIARQRAAWILCAALVTQTFFTMAPTSLAFWDPGQRFYWEPLYVPQDRAREFAEVFPLIPPTSRVASTDFVHPRFTHFERSYDYSDYPRKVSNYLPKVPDDTEYIVIDTAHPYSKIHRPEEMRELREQPPRWEIVPVDSAYYIVLKRIPDPASPATP